MQKGEHIPTRFNKWDMFALFADLISNIFIAFANFANALTNIFDTQASFVEDKKDFHEYAARTIETLQEGE
jgi:hypothetical protein